MRACEQVSHFKLNEQCFIDTMQHKTSKFKQKVSKNLKDEERKVFKEFK